MIHQNKLLTSCYAKQIQFCATASPRLEIYSDHYVEVNSVYITKSTFQ